MMEHRHFEENIEAPWQEMFWTFLIKMIENHKICVFLFLNTHTPHQYQATPPERCPIQANALTLPLI